MTKTVRIGGAGGFMEDSSISTPQLLKSGQIDYLMFDFLAEFSMSFLAGRRSGGSGNGFHPEFVNVHMRENLAQIVRSGVKVISNVGGLNPRGCRDALLALAAELGLSIKVGVVEGDDLMPRIDELGRKGFTEAYSGAPWPGEKVMSANAYFGAFPIARALDQGADIVLTGRVVDSALALGPLIHEFGWSEVDLNQLAQGSLLGHVLECGAQATGGLHTDWEKVPDWANMGYPIAEASPDGSFVITKPEGTGGLVSCATIAEQILYEVGDPQAYMLPDVVCDFSEVQLKLIGEGAVRVSGARGYPPTATYKVSVTHLDGFRTFVLMPFVGRNAEVKARRTADALIQRTRSMFRSRNIGDYRGVQIELLGADMSYGDNRARSGLREVVLRTVVDHEEKEALELFGREVNSPVTSMAPGTVTLLAGRQPVNPIIRLFSFMLSKNEAVPLVTVNGPPQEVRPTLARTFDPATIARPMPPNPPEAQGETLQVPLFELAWARSGDKGDKGNIGVIARRPDDLPWIRAALSPERVAAYFRHLFEKAGPPRIELFDLPGFHAINLLLHDALGGGGSSTRRLDLCAKSLAQQLLDIPVEIPERQRAGDGPLAELEALSVAR